jgi:hypothetical protein
LAVRGETSRDRKINETRKLLVLSVFSRGK